MKKELGAQPLFFPAPVWVIGTYDKEGKPNVMTAGWVGGCCSTPPCISIAVRKERYTHECILAHQAFTINVPSEKFVVETDFFGNVSGGSTINCRQPNSHRSPAASSMHPTSMNFRLSWNVNLIHSTELGSHTLFIGEILQSRADEEILTEKGIVDMKKLDPFVLGHRSFSYFKIGEFLAPEHKSGRILENK